jgi:hypothetical protein
VHQPIKNITVKALIMAEVALVIMEDHHTEAANTLKEDIQANRLVIMEKVHQAGKFAAITLKAIIRDLILAKDREVNMALVMDMLEEKREPIKEVQLTQGNRHQLQHQPNDVNGSTKLLFDLLIE